MSKVADRISAEIKEAENLADDDSKTSMGKFFTARFWLLQIRQLGIAGLILKIKRKVLNGLMGDLKIRLESEQNPEKIRNRQ